jgi:hypothetical protein
MPLSAWQTLIQNPQRDYDMGKFPVSITEAWTVYGLCALAATAVVVTVVHRRDV